MRGHPLGMRGIVFSGYQPPEEYMRYIHQEEHERISRLMQERQKAEAERQEILKIKNITIGSMPLATFEISPTENINRVPKTDLLLLLEDI